MFSSSQMFSSPAPAAQVGASPDSKRPREDKQTCLPVTIRAMEVAIAQRGDTGEELRFFGSEPSALILVAAVESVVRQSTGLEMSLNDATGRIKARYFVTDGETAELDRITPGAYVSAFGSLRAAPTTHFSVNGLRLVESADEVSYHMIEAAHAALRLQRPEREAETPAPKKVAAEPMADLTPQKVEGSPAAALSTPTPAAPASTPAAERPAASKPTGQLTGPALRSAILAALREDGVDPNEGLAISTLCGRLSAATEADVRECIKGLVDQGDAFETLDEHHIAAV